MKRDDLAAKIGARPAIVAGRFAALDVDRLSSVSAAYESSLVFAEESNTLEAALKGVSCAVLTTDTLAESTGSEDQERLLLSAQPKLAFARAGAELGGTTAAFAPGVHPTAILSAGAQVENSACIGAYAVVGAGAVVGKGSWVGEGAVVGAGVCIGADCRIYPRVVLYPGVRIGDRVKVHAGAVLGGDGFGYVRDRETGAYLQFPQVGTLLIEDDVEIGANSTVDRGALEQTRIARGVKIDNLVHVGHNVQVEEDVVIAALTGISGSSVIGQQAIVGGQVGIGDHATIGPGVILGSGSGVLSNKKLKGAGVVHWGRPARPLRRYLKELATLARLAGSGKE